MNSCCANDVNNKWIERRKEKATTIQWIRHDEVTGNAWTVEGRQLSTRIRKRYCKQLHWKHNFLRGGNARLLYTNEITGLPSERSLSLDRSHAVRESSREFSRSGKRPTKAGVKLQSWSNASWIEWHALCWKRDSISAEEVDFNLRLTRGQR